MMKAEGVHDLHQSDASPEQKKHKMSRTAGVARARFADSEEKESLGMKRLLEAG